MTHKRKHSSSQDDPAQDGAAGAPTDEQPRLKQPRKANGRFVKMKKSRSVKRTNVATPAVPTSRQASAITLTHLMQPEGDPVPTLAQDADVPAEAHQLFSGRLRDSIVQSFPVPPRAANDTLPPSLIPPTTNTSPSPYLSAEERALQNQRTAAVVTWLQHIRKYEQEEQLVHPLNLLPQEKIRPLAIYQRQYVRDRGLVGELPRSTFGEVGDEEEGMVR